MKGKSLYAALLVAATPGMWGLSAAEAGTLDDIKARGELICGVLGNSEPFGYEDPGNRQVVGYEIDLCKDLAGTMDVTPTIKVIAPQARIPELQQGRVDLLAALISYTNERAEQVDFSNTYLVDSFRCMVKKDSGITGLDGLADKRISVQKGGLIEAALRSQFPNATVLSYDDVSERFVAFQQGKAAATCDRATLLRALQIRAKNEATTTILPEALNMMQKAGFAVRKGDKDFVDYLNQFLATYESSGKGQALFDRWVGASSNYDLSRDFKMGDDIASQ
ncbi:MULTISPECIES: ABC transporter substrate-binding protein [Chelativorans]|nr:MULTISPECIES: ABC transporter substrate-binding protein [Chelativorans]